MRSARLNVPQSRLTSNGAPATFSPLAGICDWLSAAMAVPALAAPARTKVATHSFSFDFILIPPWVRRLPISYRPSILRRQNLFAPVAVYHVLDNFNAEARADGRIDPALNVFERLGHQIVLHRIAERLELEQLASRRIKRNRQARRADDRRRPGMSVGLPAIEFASFGNLLKSRDALGATGIDANDVDGAGRQHTLKLLKRPFALAVGNARRGLGADVGVALGIPSAERLLDPGKIILLHGLRSPHRVVDVPFDRDAVVDHQHLVAEHLAHGLDVGDVAVVIVAKAG